MMFNIIFFKGFVMAAVFVLFGMVAALVPHAHAQATPEVSIAGGDAVVEGGGSAIFTLTATPAPTSPLPVSVNITQSGNYVTTGSKTVTISVAGTATLIIPAPDDRVDEVDGSVTVTVSSGNGYTVSSSNGAATINISDNDVPVATISADSDSVTEGKDIVFTVAFDIAVAETVEVQATRTKGGDYGVTAGTDVFEMKAGTRTSELQITTDGDSAYEVDGFVTLTLVAGTGYTVSDTNNAATVAIQDDDVPEIGITPDGDVVEGSNAVFTVSANPAPQTPVTVNVDVVQFGDYGVETGSRTVTIPSSGRASLTIATAGDTTDEENGFVTATLTSGSDYTISSIATTATVVIADDEPPVLSISGAPGVFGASAVIEGGIATFTIVASTKPASDITVRYAVTQSGNYLSSNYFASDTLETGTLTMTPYGQVTSHLVTLQDQVDEQNGSITVTLVAGTGYTVSDSKGSATVPVVDNDGADFPIIGIGTGGIGVDEGDDAEFALHITPVLTTPITVNIEVTQTGGYVTSGGSRAVTVPINTSIHVISVTTIDDREEKDDGSVTVTLVDGADYDVSTSKPNGTMKVFDNDERKKKKSGGGGSIPSSYRGGAPSLAAAFSPSAAPTEAVAAYVEVSQPSEAVAAHIETEGDQGSFQFDNALSPGVANNDVYKLQKFLNREGYVVSESGAGAAGFETTYFGNRTKNALIRYQQAEGLPTTGVFDVATKEKVNRREMFVYLTHVVDELQERIRVLLQRQ